MYVSPETLRFMLDLGLPGEKLVELFQRLEDDAEIGAPVTDIPSAEVQALERRRAKDRDRKRKVRGNSAELSEELSADVSAEPSLPPPSSPGPPSPPAHSREGPTTRAKGQRPRSRRVPDDWLPNAKTVEVATGEGFTPGELERELSQMRDHEFRDPHADWDAVARKWLRTAAERRPRIVTRNDHEQQAKPTSRQANIGRAFAGFELAPDHGGRKFGDP